MAFRKISYLIPSCDGCGLAWSFYDPACAEGIPPHFASRADALAQLEADYRWPTVRLCRVWPLTACRRCAAAGVTPATVGRRRLLAVARGAAGRGGGRGRGREEGGGARRPCGGRPGTADGLARPP